MLPPEGRTDEIRGHHIRDELQQPGILPLHEELIVEGPVLLRTLLGPDTALFLQNVAGKLPEKVPDERIPLCQEQDMPKLVAEVRESQKRRSLSRRNADDVELRHRPVILIREGGHEWRRQGPSDLCCQALAESGHLTIGWRVPFDKEERVRLDDAHTLTPALVQLEVVWQEEGEPEAGIVQQLHDLAADDLHLSIRLQCVGAHVRVRGNGCQAVP